MIDSGISKRSSYLLVRQYLLLTFVSAVVIACCYSCSKEAAANSPQVTALIESLKKQNPSCNCAPYLSQCTWRNKTVYMLGYNAPDCSWKPTFYDSNGQQFDLPTGYTYQDFDQESSFVKNVWTCK